MTWSAKDTASNFNFAMREWVGNSEITFTCFDPYIVTAFHAKLGVSQTFIVRYDGTTLFACCQEIEQWFLQTTLTDNSTARICPCGIDSRDCDYHK